MILSELLDMAVRDADGTLLGRVVDVRFRRAARRSGREGDLELIALIVSPHSRLSLYGYERGRVDKPVVIARIITWLHRKSRVVPWECVDRIDEDVVVLGVPAPVIPLNTRTDIPASQPDSRASVTRRR